MTWLRLFRKRVHLVPFGEGGTEVFELVLSFLMSLSLEFTLGLNGPLCVVVVFKESEPAER